MNPGDLDLPNNVNGFTNEDEFEEATQGAECACDVNEQNVITIDYDCAAEAGLETYTDIEN